jgi:hypothetical protein
VSFFCPSCACFSYLQIRGTTTAKVKERKNSIAQSQATARNADLYVVEKTIEIATAELEGMAESVELGKKMNYEKEDERGFKR